MLKRFVFTNKTFCFKYKDKVIFNQGGRHQIAKGGGWVQNKESRKRKRKKVIQKTHILIEQSN